MHHSEAYTSADSRSEPIDSLEFHSLETFLANPVVMLSFAPDTIKTIKGSLLFEAQQRLAEVPGQGRLLLVEGWPRLSFEDGVIARKLWQLTQPAHHDAYLTQTTELKAALPEITVDTLPLGSMLETLVNGYTLSKIPFEHFFTPQSPNGTEALSALAGLVITRVYAAARLPEEPTEKMGLTASLFESYAALAVEIEEVVSGTLLPFLPAPELNRLVGTAEDDLLTLPLNVDLVDGGAGIDQLLIGNSAETSEISVGPAGEILLRTDIQEVQIQGIERLVFNDGVIAFDDEGLAGQAYRLYQACFDRIPDAEGLGFWIRHLDAGNVTLTEAAGYFLTSEEFTQVYGAPEVVDDFEYLTLLYANVLDREPDMPGFEFWRQQQDNGITRSDMLVHFSESSENVAKVAPAIDDGIWYL